MATTGERRMVSVLFCGRCGSGLVDVFGTWPDGRRTLRCCTCGHQTQVDNFTVGRLRNVPLPIVQRAEQDRAAQPQHFRAWALAEQEEYRGRRLALADELRGEDEADATALALTALDAMRGDRG